MDKKNKKEIKVKTQKVKKTVGVDLNPEKTEKKTGKAGKLLAIEADLFNKEGKIVGKINLPEKIFGEKENMSLVSQAVRVYLANQRSGSANTKTRGQVKGSTRKIYKQKGTGRARHGDIKAPIFVGGGIAFGPKIRDFSLSLSKKMIRKALFGALSFKNKSNNLIILDSLVSLPVKTKEMIKVLNSLKIFDAKNKKRENNLLLVLGKKSEDIKKTGRNIKGVLITTVNSLNTYEIMKNRKIIFLKEAVEELYKIFKV